MPPNASPDDSLSMLKGLLKKGRENLASMIIGEAEPPGPSGRSLNRSVTLFQGHEQGNVKDKFSFGKELGRGAFGKVVIATDKVTGIEYACKIVPLKNLGSKGQLETMIQEAEVMLHLRGHPNILKIHSFMEDSENLYVVEELCSGGDLVEAVTSSSLNSTEGLVANIMHKILEATILEAVAQCHGLGVIHRDIKLDNFLLSGSQKPIADQLRLADFGCSEFTNETERITGSAGTMEYMAPEVFEKSYSFPSDVWSCGVVM
eukprot:gene26311-17405_t